MRTRIVPSIGTRVGPVYVGARMYSSLPRTPQRPAQPVQGNPYLGTPASARRLRPATTGDRLLVALMILVMGVVALVVVSLLAAGLGMLPAQSQSVTHTGAGCVATTVHHVASVPKATKK
jgi:hypothetical protein